jgi:pimeloyl-ACP methyl ester carboxylesterase
MPLSDGRQLGYAVWGSTSPNAKVISWPHGLPGSRLSAYWADQWGKQNGYTFICPERPGCGLSTMKRKYTVLEHGRDMWELMAHLGHRQYKVFGVSNGGPYALALAHLASKKEVTGVLLVCPTSPPEALRIGQGITAFWWRLKVIYFSGLAESYLRKRMSKAMKVWAQWPSNEIVRRWAKGAEALERRERMLAFAGRVADQRLTDVPWCFGLENVHANKVIILAGGLDKNTPAAGAQYMRNRLHNCKLVIEPGEDHFSLQKNHGKPILDQLNRL